MRASSADAPPASSSRAAKDSRREGWNVGMVRSSGSGGEVDQIRRQSSVFRTTYWVLSTEYLRWISPCPRSSCGGVSPLCDAQLGAATPRVAKRFFVRRANGLLRQGSEPRIATKRFLDAAIFERMK